MASQMGGANAILRELLARSAFSPEKRFVNVNRDSQIPWRLEIVRCGILIARIPTGARLESRHVSILCAR
jgi:hypothetical protein